MKGTAMDLNMINHPEHYLLDRFIQPIDVIEDWTLCHHLACVVKYICRAGRKNHILEDLKKAEWYLVRELTRYQNNFNKCHLALINPTPLSLEAVLQDWQLSAHLEQSLSNIRRSKNQSLKIDSLIKALMYLRAEIKVHQDEILNHKS